MSALSPYPKNSHWPEDVSILNESTLAELFEDSVDRNGDRIAVVFEGQELRYRELEAAANRLAHLLIERGAGPGSYVGLFLPRSPEMLVAMLGILKSGAAYVPLDPEYPADRVQAILEDSGAKTLVSVLGLANRIPEGIWNRVLMDEEQASLQASASSRPQLRAQAGDPCYAIFTSGSTGRPKGVAVSHRSVCHLVRAEGRLFGVKPEDRVFQGFSIAFDASVEEVWLAFYAGAALVVGSARQVKSGPLLANWLQSQGVTVLSTVPTLLGTFEDDIASLRLLIVGGEACPEDLVRRWALPGRRMVNTYGPTEATVIATWTDLVPGTPVTIGRAIPNLRTYVLDEHLVQVVPGQEGELCISGIGLALGYLGKPELTQARFPENPYAEGVYTERLYRTGDKVRELPEGDLEFLGRFDDQVKVRGFRIELGEIESALRQQPDVVQAAAHVMRDGEVDTLVGYVVLREGTAFNEDELRAGVRRSLPPYMVPTRLAVLEALPTLSSGKLDRKRLPEPPPKVVQTQATRDEPRTSTERLLAEHWCRLFHREQVGRDENFFIDLGGHSLLAALMVSGLRKLEGFEGLSVPDVYTFPSLRELAEEMDRRAEHRQAAERPAAVRAPAWMRSVCQGGQWLGLYPLFAFFGLQWIAPYLTYSWMIDQEHTRLVSLGVAISALLLVNPCMFLLSIVAKWTLLGRIRPGSHRLWGFFYCRWWFVSRIQAATPTHYLVGTPWMRIYARLMGAKVGSGVHLATDCLRNHDLIEIGDDTCIGTEARLEAYTIEAGVLHLGTISIGADCCVGARSVLAPGSRMEAHAELGDLSLLPEGACIPEGQQWTGSPARPYVNPPARLERGARPSFGRKAAMAIVQCLGAMVVPVVFLSSILPGMMLLNELWVNLPGYFAYLWAVPIAAISYVALMSLIIVFAKRVVIGRLKPGTYDLTSAYFLRKWFVDQLMGISLDLLAPLYATLYLNPWYRALGAKVGPRAEISTAGAATPDLLEIGEETFIADAASLGTPRYDRGQVVLAMTRVGKRAFVGNSAAVPGGSELGDQTLVGVLSCPPQDPLEAARFDSSWLGSPAIFLPRRSHAEGFNEELTFRPSRRIVALRLFIEFFRVTLPAMGFALLTCLILTAISVLEDVIGLRGAMLLFPLIYFLAGSTAALFVVGMKWLMVGRYKPGEKPLWCSFVWRTELISGLHENLAVPWLLMMAQGTPLVPLYFRALGARIGRGVHMESTWLTEYDLISIGDEVCLGADCTVQTHLFEDRVMKMSTVELGHGCSVGTDAVVLYGTRMEDGSSLGDLSLLMKGEILPAGSRWQGSPARRMT